MWTQTFIPSMLLFSSFRIDFIFIFIRVCVCVCVCVSPVCGFLPRPEKGIRFSQDEITGGCELAYENPWNVGAL